MAENKDYISMTNEDGTIRDKGEFLKEMEMLYDDMAQEATCEGSYFLDITNPENAIDVESVVETFDFVERHIYITEVIEPEMANAIFEVVKLWNTMDEIDKVPIEERVPIKIYINTPGGDLEAVFSIISTIKLSKTPVYTYTIGTGYSGGFFIGICGHKRFGYPYSFYCFHEGSYGIEGDSHKTREAMKFYEHQLSLLKQITLENTNITEAQYNNNIKDDWYMDTAEALKLGVIDEISTEV